MNTSSFEGRQKKKLYVFLALFFVISFATKYIDWKIYRIEITRAENNDGLKYKNMAWQMIEGKTPREYVRNFGLRPAFIAYLASLMKVFGYDSDFEISVINMALISLFLTVLVYLIMDRYGPDELGRSFAVAVIFAAGNPLILFWSPFILTDIVSLMPLILGLFVYLKITHKGKYAWLGVIYGLAFHIREVTAVNFAALVVVMLATHERKRDLGVMVLVYLALVVPWLAYIQSQTSVSPLLHHLGKAVEARDRTFETGQLPFFARFMANIARHYGMRISDGGPIDAHGYYAIFYTMGMYAMGVLGLACLYVRRNLKELYLVSFSLIFTAVFYGFVGEGPYMRGRVPVEYLWIYVASIGLMAVLSKRGRRQAC
ncbi:MAG: glycosyltransferase family 39 protein [Candidatus Omnitrophota bacterium]